MEERPRFFMTDVFGEKRYSGNQLATFMNCASLSDEEMQRIAREINFSETTFILSDKPRDGGYDVRIFTPGAEVDFAGHPTLGTAFIIQRHIIEAPVDKVVLNLKVGPIPVSFSGEEDQSGMMWMDQNDATFGDAFDVDVLSGVLNLSREDFDSRFPIRDVSTGLPHIIVPLKNLEALKKAAIDTDRYYSLVNDLRAKCIFIFCPESYDDSHDLGVRMFADHFGVPEDPATGSGNGCLAGYLVKHDYFQSPEIDIKTGQGYEVGRPSLLSLRARKRGGSIAVAVGGRVTPIAEGWWNGPQD